MPDVGRKMTRGAIAGLLYMPWGVLPGTEAGYLRTCRARLFRRLRLAERLPGPRSGHPHGVPVACGQRFHLLRSAQSGCVRRGRPGAVHFALDLSVSILFLSLTSSLFVSMAGLPTYARTASVCPAVTAWKRCARCRQRERCGSVGNAPSKRRREAHSPQSCALTSGVGASYANGASHSELPTPCRAFSGHRRGRCPRAASPSCAHEPDDARRSSVHF